MAIGYDGAGKIIILHRLSKMSDAKAQIDQFRNRRRASAGIARRSSPPHVPDEPHDRYRQRPSSHQYMPLLLMPIIEITLHPILLNGCGANSSKSDMGISMPFVLTGAL